MMNHHGALPRSMLLLSRTAELLMQKRHTTRRTAHMRRVGGSRRVRKQAVMKMRKQSVNSFIVFAMGGGRPVCADKQG